MRGAGNTEYARLDLAHLRWFHENVLDNAQLLLILLLRRPLSMLFQASFSAVACQRVKRSRCGRAEIDRCVNKPENLLEYILGL
jgi:hypothetical protein